MLEESSDGIEDYDDDGIDPDSDDEGPPDADYHYNSTPINKEVSSKKPGTRLQSKRNYNAYTSIHLLLRGSV
jgi:hypothetical protein